MTSKQMTSEAQASDVLEQLSGKHVLITGTTGFLGKVVLEKLIRSVPDIGGIHLLIRGNQYHEDAHNRFLSEVASSSVFERLRNEDREALDTFIETRVHCITGELTEPRFGLAIPAFRELAGNIDAFINAADGANGREALDRTLQINTLCLNSVVSLASCNPDMAVIQVSSCYVNGRNSGHVTESVTRPAGKAIPCSPDDYFNDNCYDVEELVRRLQSKIAHARTRDSGKRLEKKLVDMGIREANRYGWSDTHTFTKWLGEQLLMNALPGRSLTLLRPSIIESALEEPAPGWIGGLNVADAIILAYARESASLVPGKRSGILDVIPVDLVANGIILSLAEVFAVPGKRRVYQCCSGSSNPLSMGQFIEHVVTEAKSHHAEYQPLFDREPAGPFVAVNRRLFGVVAGGLRLPLALVDRALRLGGPNRELKALRKLETSRSLASTFGFYTAPDYIFRNDALLSLASRMSALDRRLFPVDARQIDWSQYLRKVHMDGLNRYVLKDQKRYSPASESVRNRAA